ncbi:MAG: glycosyltransferase family 2 protein, partial [Thermodesulfobacteriota bacterium]
MSSNKPLISVIIPVYNCEKYLGEAVESVLEQTYKPMEIIVVNDGSTDQSEKVAKNYLEHIKYFYQNNFGIGAARNKGIELSTGEYLSFLDSDDIWVKDKLKIQIESLNSDESIDAVFGHVKQFLSPEILEDLKKKYKCPQSPMPGRLASTILIRKSNFLIVGHFTNNKSLGADLDWYLRAEEKRLKIMMLDTVLLKRRIHNSNTGILQRDNRTDYVKHLK